MHKGTLATSCAKNNGGLDNLLFTSRFATISHSGKVETLCIVHSEKMLDLLFFETLRLNSAYFITYQASYLRTRLSEFAK